MTMLVHDSQSHIGKNVKADKEFFRIDKMFCQKCREHTMMLESCKVEGSKVSLMTNCECGQNDKFITNEKTLLKQMFEIEFKECLYFRAFRVFYLHDFFIDETSRGDARNLVKRLEKKYKHRKWFYRILNWRNKK